MLQVCYDIIVWLSVPCVVIASLFCDITYPYFFLVIRCYVHILLFLLLRRNLLAGDMPKLLRNVLYIISSWKMKSMLLSAILNCCGTKELIFHLEQPMHDHICELTVINGKSCAQLWRDIAISNTGRDSLSLWTVTSDVTSPCHIIGERRCCINTGKPTQGGIMSKLTKAVKITRSQTLQTVLQYRAKQ